MCVCERERGEKERTKKNLRIKKILVKYNDQQNKNDIQHFGVREIK